MKVFLVIKTMGKTRGFNRVGIELNDKEMMNAASLIHFLVHREIDRYESEEWKALSQEEINERIDTGKIAFGFKYREHDRIDREEAVRIAVEAFQDEWFALFINEQQIETLDDHLTIADGDDISLVRLTMLSGRYF